MGFESFRVDLRGGRAAYCEVSDGVRALPHVRPDADSVPTHDATYYAFDDGNHVIEFEVRDAPVRLSCRFTLCHPVTVDAVFLELLRDLMEHLGLAATVCDAVPNGETRSFALDEFADFSAVASRCIAIRRAEWIGAFGDETLAATTSAVHERVILPRCQPEVRRSM
jgi:hypothetical protein